MNFLFYAGYNKETGEEQIGLAKSNNFNDWEYVGDKPIIPLRSQGEFDEIQTSNPCVLKHDGLYKMWYQGKSKNGYLNICYAQSRDGQTWVSSKDSIHLQHKQNIGYRDGFHHPHVVFDKLNNKFKMWFVFYDDELTSINYSESTDGYIWTDFIKTNIFSEERNCKIWYPYIMIDENKYKIWFTKRSLNKIWSIYYSESLDGLNWIESVEVLSLTKSKSLTLFFEFVSKITNFSFDIPIYGIGSPFVWKENGKYRLIGHAVGPNGKLYIPMYESMDGKKWEKIKNNILPKPNTSWNEFFQADPYILINE